MKSSAATRRGRGGSPARGAVDGELAIKVLAQFREVFRAAKLHFAAVRRSAGVSGAQLWALWELHEQPGLQVSELTRKMSLHQSTVSNLVEKMCAGGLVLRGGHPQDRRVVRLRLSAAGKKVVARAPKPARGILPDALARMPLEDLRLLQGSLQRLIGNMRARAPGAAKTHLENI